METIIVDILKKCMGIGEIKRDIKKLKDGIHVIYDENLTEDIIKRLDDIENKFDKSQEHWESRRLDKIAEIDEIKEHDIFKIWKSARQGGKNILAAILNLNQGIKGLRGRINREQERINELERNYLLLNCNVKKRLDKLGDKKQTFFFQNFIPIEGKWYHLQVHLSKDAAQIYVNNVEVFPFKDKDSGGEKIPIGEDLMKRIMNHKSVPMDKSKLKEKLPKLNVPEKYQPYENVSLDPTKPVYDDIPEKKYKGKKFTPFGESLGVPLFYNPDYKIPNDFEGEMSLAEENARLKAEEKIINKWKDEYKLEPKEPTTFDLKVDLPDDGILMEAPEIIDFNGTIYGKIEDFVNDLDGDIHFHNIREKTRRKWKALLNEQD